MNERKASLYTFTGVLRLRDNSRLKRKKHV